RPDRLPDRRPPAQARPRQHGRLARGPRAVPRPPAGRVRLSPADRAQGARPRNETGAAQGGRRPGAAAHPRAREARAHRAARGLGGCDGRFPSGWTDGAGVSSTAATVVWTGADGERASCRAPGGATLGGSATPRGRGLQVVRLEGLAPSTRYVCRLGTAGGTVRFRTAPAADEPFTFAAVGDTGDGSREAAALARRILAGRPAFLVHLGDMAYPSSRTPTLDARFFRPYRR